LEEGSIVDFLSCLLDEADLFFRETSVSMASLLWEGFVMVFVSGCPRAC